jgi:hypothetical protein
VSSLVLLRRDALQVGSDGHPYLRFQNVKLAREAVIPVAPPARGAPGMGRGGRFHITPGSVNELLRSYVRKATSAMATGSSRPGFTPTPSATTSAPAWSMTACRCP